MATTDTTVLADLLRTAYQLRAYQALRTQLVWEQFVTPGLVQWTSGSDPQPGSTVTFTFINDLSETPATISESTDVTAQSMSDTQISVTAQEYGGAVVVTQRLNAVGLFPVSPIAAERINRQMRGQIDGIAKAVAQAGTNVSFGGNATARANVDSADLFASVNVRKAVARLRAAGAMPIDGVNYAAIMHGDVSVDLRGEAGATSGGWRPPHEYQRWQNIMNGEVGTYEGARFIESPRAPQFVDAGTASQDVFATVFCGWEAFAKAVGYMPEIVLTPITDLLRRFAGVGWKAMLGYGRFREGAIHRVESASSITA